MKSLCLLLSIPLILSLALPACGYSGDKCAQVERLRIQWIDEACRDQTDCCLCTCWNDGHKSVETPNPCTCIDPEPVGGECVGLALQVAEACLAEKEACKSQILAPVTTACGGDGNECDQADAIHMQGFEEACLGKDTACCFCKCYNDGHKYFNTDEYFQNQTCLCEGSFDPQPRPCKGEDLQAAQACLADAVTCKQQAKDLVNAVDFGLCATTPL
jgi:hypothetical protein